MSKFFFLIYGTVSYLLFFVTFLCAIGFVGGYVLPKTINDGTEGPLTTAILINVLLLGLFGLQHSIMARPEFKAHWTKIMPKPIERSTFVLLTSLILQLMFWQWRPMPETVWQVDNTIGSGILTVVFFLGFLIVLYATFLIDHFDLFGLKQVILHFQGKKHVEKEFKSPSLYKLVRHPIMLGFIIAFWSTPHMTQGHLLFAVVTTVYILVAIQLEERDLKNILGGDYMNYSASTSMILPVPKKK